MRTVNEVSKLTGVSIRALQYYDKIGLLAPSGYTASGYRLYDDTALETLQQILLLKELEFPLKEIAKILSSPGFDREKALNQQIELLLLKKEHLEQLISFAREVKEKGEIKMDFTAFDTKKIEEYKERAKAQWGDTPAYQEYEKKNGHRSAKEENVVMHGLLELFVEFGGMKEMAADENKPQAQVKKLQDYISEHFYHCTNEILAGLGQMYAADGEFKKNIDHAGGDGTADFVAEAIRIYCERV